MKEKKSISGGLKNVPEPGQTSPEGPNKGDELLSRLLKLKAPIVQEPALSTNPSDIKQPVMRPALSDIEEVLRAYPGLTPEEAGQIIKDLGF